MPARSASRTKLEKLREEDGERQFSVFLSSKVPSERRVSLCSLMGPRVFEKESQVVGKNKHTATC